MIIPVFNGEKYIKAAITSVLSQMKHFLEIVVIDDGSNDHTSTVVQELIQNYQNIYYKYQENRGVGVARNYGVEISQGEFLTFLDADDLWAANKLTIQINAFKQNPDIDIVFGQVEHFISPELSTQEAQRWNYPHKIMPAYAAGAMLLRRETFNQVGKFSETCEVGQFLDWYLRAIELNLISFFPPDVVLLRRVHNDNSSQKSKRYWQDYVRIIKSSLDRRRSQS
ncbi:glycosyltransferase family A protein [Thermosynechococcaceae cyanobacterium BACA0444]|uniref:Glycosyltransferase family A protein n=1 Tax=Pseudocalidococcus azoricus BACA0444 TaxID=2918990 RepID=A0AAE4FRW4_9CYAN|nr:glycosyltransferase family A protein [Pseudocalidococcus azoricus]MDS3861153.1 glycosyltransferase family A protein [Pseudocalidococcus azoricus BACA0444]